jgi:hypothetical protein
LEHGKSISKEDHTLDHGTRISKEEQEDLAIGAWNKNKHRRPRPWSGTRINKEDHAIGAWNKNKQGRTRRPRHWSMEQE